MIKPGDIFPALPVWYLESGDVSRQDSARVFARGKTVFFTVPGAYTPTCHNHHLPGYVVLADRFFELGVSRIICAAVNDHHVLKAWAKDQRASDRVGFIADFDARLADALGLTRDMGAGGLGTRYLRTAMLIEQGVVKYLAVDDQPGTLTGTGASSVLDLLRTRCTSNSSSAYETVC